MGIHTLNGESSAQASPLPWRPEPWDQADVPERDMGESLWREGPATKKRGQTLMTAVAPRHDGPPANHL